MSAAGVAQWVQSFAEEAKALRALATEQLARHENEQLLKSAVKNSTAAVTQIDSIVGAGNVSARRADIEKCLATWTEALLDETFFHENALVESAFPDSEDAQFERLLERLQRPTQLCDDLAKALQAEGAEAPSPSPAVAALGAEMAEVLLWRRGALHYMQCHTVVNDPCRLSTLRPDRLDEGVRQLVAMLSIRAAVPNDPFARPPPPDVPPEDDGKLEQFMREGIMSDTHLLALAYCGEMAYWRWKHAAGGDEAKSTAVNALKKYIRVVHELLEMQQPHWDTSRAFAMLQELC